MAAHDGPSDAPSEAEAPSPSVEQSAVRHPAEERPPEAPAEAADESDAHEPDAGTSSEVLRPEPTGDRHWYILKVQSNREDSIRDALERRIKIAGLTDFFGEIIVPIEMVSEFKGGKKRVVKRKLYPGYIMVNMEINEDTWFLVRETPGIGDFTGSGGKPSPMLPHEVSRIVTKAEEKTDEAPKLKISFKPGDRAKITEGTFENFEGDVDSIDEQNGRVTVMINIFGRSTPVELEYWQIEAI
ncbi:MAG: transcription termination/antitermination factor NusG [Planctomycetia bacterium]|nr:transcription termination/antitermination factor NusG [Planctomycetia bacterium]